MSTRQNFSDVIVPYVGVHLDISPLLHLLRDLLFLIFIVTIVVLYMINIILRRSFTFEKD